MKSGSGLYKKAVEQLRGVPSKYIYNRLVEEGIHPGPGDMDALLTLLEDEGQIHTLPLVGDSELYGGKRVDNVSEELIRNYT